MLLSAKKHTKTNKHRDRKKYLLHITQLFVLPLQYIAFFRAYLVTILKALAALFESNAGL